MIVLKSKKMLIDLINKDYEKKLYVRGKKGNKVYNIYDNKLIANCYDYICIEKNGDMYINDSKFFDKKQNYKQFESVYLGFSDIAALKVVGCDKTRGIEANIINMGSDGIYEAYYCNNAIIGKHYKKVYDVEGWIEIYDDVKKRFQDRGKFEIYRAGDFGIVINKIT